MKTEATLQLKNQRSVRISQHEQFNSNQYLKLMYNKPESVGNMTDEQDDNTTTTKQNDKTQQTTLGKS